MNKSNMQDFNHYPKAAIQILREGLILWVKTYVLAFPFALLIGLLYILLLLEMVTSYEGQLAHLSPNEPMPLSLFLFTLSFIIVTLILQAGMTYRINAFLQNRTLAFNTAFYAALKKALPIAGIYLICSFAVSLGFMVFVIPGLIIGNYLLFSYYMVILADKGVIEAIVESYRLVSGQFWRTVWVFSLILLLYFLLIIALFLMIQFIPFLAKALFGEAILSASFKFYYPIFVVSLLIIILYPLLTTCLLLLFYDLRNRKNLEKDSKPSSHFLA